MWGFDVWNSLIRGRLFSLSTLHCSGEIRLVWAFMERAALCPSQCVSGDYLIPWRSRMWLQISYLLMAFTRRGTQPREKGSIFFRYISSLALRRKKWQSDYCHTELKSTFLCSNCRVARLISMYVCFCLYFWGEGKCRCVGAGGLWAHWNWHSCAFQLVNPLVGRCGLQEAEWTGPHPQSRVEKGGDKQHSSEIENWTHQLYFAATICPLHTSWIIYKTWASNSFLVLLNSFSPVWGNAGHTLYVIYQSVCQKK